MNLERLCVFVKGMQFLYTSVIQTYGMSFITTYPACGEAGEQKQEQPGQVQLVTFFVCVCHSWNEINLRTA